ncbi:hypothetical protein Pfo_030672 [Paulownia fortunei]|nr:hypothetical protein Pfo_030672 [Paulownia fortunei]
MDNCLPEVTPDDNGGIFSCSCFSPSKWSCGLKCPKLGICVSLGTHLQLLEILVCLLFLKVLFSEPVVITACEFLEQNASSICPAVKLMGATSPPSFALEVFIQCEGETRFRRLCLPCLYSHSSSNMLEVEAVVTNHFVVRGSYRSLSMVIYGNTAEDLGQFNIEVDLDTSLTDTVTAVEGNLEDLPPAFHPTMLTIRELVSPLKILSQAVVVLDIPLELRNFCC